MPKQIENITLHSATGITAAGTSILHEIGNKHPSRIIVYFTITNYATFAGIGFYVLGSDDGVHKAQIFFSDAANDYWGRTITGNKAFGIVIPGAPFIGNWIGIEWAVSGSGSFDLSAVAVIEKYSAPEMEGVA